MASSARIQLIVIPFDSTYSTLITIPAPFIFNGRKHMSQDFTKAVAALNSAMQASQSGGTSNREVRRMNRRYNPVQSFIRNIIRLIAIVPLWWLFALPDFQSAFSGTAEVTLTPFFWGIVKTIFIIWLSNVLASQLAHADRVYSSYHLSCIPLPVSSTSASPRTKLRPRRRSRAITSPLT